MTLQIGILVFPHVQQLDLTGPYEVFASMPAANVHLIWKDRSAITSATGLVLAPTMTFAECPALDVLCIPGGAGINALLGDAEVLDFVRAQAARARYVTSVCTGALVLGAAGLLKGRRATTHWVSHDFLAKFGAIPTHGRVVRDGNLFTAGGVTAGIDFGLAVVAELAWRGAGASDPARARICAGTAVPRGHAGDGAARRDRRCHGARGVNQEGARSNHRRACGLRPRHAVLEANRVNAKSVDHRHYSDA